MVPHWSAQPLKGHDVALLKRAQKELQVHLLLGTSMLGVTVAPSVLTAVSPLRNYSRPRSMIAMPHPLLKSIARVHTINILGVELTEKVGSSNCIKHLTIKARQSYYALRILKSHGLLGDCLFDGVRSTTYGRMLYCSPVWRVFTDGQKRGALVEIIRKLVLLGYLPLSAPHLRFFVAQLTPISLPVFFTILVMYCIRCGID